MYGTVTCAGQVSGQRPTYIFRRIPFYVLVHTSPGQRLELLQGRPEWLPVTVSRREGHLRARPRPTGATTRRAHPMQYIPQSCVGFLQVFWLLATYRLYYNITYHWRQANVAQSI